MAAYELQTSPNSQDNPPIPPYCEGNPPAQARNSENFQIYGQNPCNVGYDQQVIENQGSAHELKTSPNSQDNRPVPPYYEGNPPAQARNSENFQIYGQNPCHVGYDQHVIGNQGFYATSQGSMVVQNATAPYRASHSGRVVVSQPQTQHIVTGRSRGSDLTIPSILVCFCCCWCTGIPGIIYAQQAQKCYDDGDYDTAELNQGKARRWMIATVGVHLFIWMIYAVVYFAMKQHNLSM